MKKRIKRAEGQPAAVAQPEVETFQAQPAPGLRGSLTVGVTLVVIGLILLANTRFGLSLAWITGWWPLAIVAIGAYLVYKRIQEKSDSD